MQPSEHLIWRAEDGSRSSKPNKPKAQRSLNIGTLYPRALGQTTFFSFKTKGGARGEKGEKGPPAIVPQLIGSRINENYELVRGPSDNTKEVMPLRPAFDRDKVVELIATMIAKRRNHSVADKVFAIEQMLEGLGWTGPALDAINRIVRNRK